jgi:MoxR-like ATPase
MSKNFFFTNVSLSQERALSYSLPDEEVNLIFQSDPSQVKDSVFSLLVPNNNYGSIEDIHLYAWTQSGKLNVNRVAIEFDLSSIPTDAKIHQALLSLYFNSTSRYNNSHQGDNAFYIQRIISPWQENTITWNTQPQATTINQVSVPTTTCGNQNLTKINVTNLVQDLIKDRQNSFGFLLKLQNETPYKILLLASNQHQNIDLRPQLEVNYSVQLVLPLILSTKSDKNRPLKRKTKMQDKLHKLRGELNKSFLERGSVIDGTLATMLIGGNAVLFGPPGCAKSMMLLEICNAIEGATFFNRLLQKAMPPEELLGQYSLNKLKQNDELIRNTKNRLPEAHIAFLDEIFRCNLTTLNALLRIINEHLFENPDPTLVPLLFLVGAANHVPSDDEMAAFVDRFIYKPWVSYVKRRPSRRELLKRANTGVRPEITTRLTLDEVYKLRLEYQSVTISNDMIEQLLDAQIALEKEGFVISDRKIQKLLHFAKAYAFVQGDDEVYVDHLHEFMPDCIWKLKEDERVTIHRILQQAIPSINQRIQQLLDALRADYSQVVAAGMAYDHNPDTNSEQNLIKAVKTATNNLNNIRNKIEKAIEANSTNNTGKVAKVLEELEKQELELAEYRDRIYR